MGPVESPRPPSPEQWAFLGALRFVLALCVAIFHCGGSDDSFAVTNTFFGGTGAVVGFLFVSGFSIAWSLEARPQGFLKRRFVRIYPVYLAGLLVPLGLGYLRQEPAWNIAGYFFFLQGVLVPQIRSVIGVTWSLAAEWWLYVLGPFLKVPTARIGAFVGMAFTAVFCAMFSWRAVLYGMWGVPVLGCAGFWLAGFVVARKPKDWPLIIFAIAASVATFTFGWFSNKDHLRISSSLTACSGILAIATLPSVPSRWVKPCNLLGDVSYPLYIIHMSVLERGGPWYFSILEATAAAFAFNAMDHAVRLFLGVKVARSSA